MSAVIPSFTTWEACPSCSGGPSPGARALMAHYLESVPVGFSMGIYNCRDIRGGNSMSVHACGRACDLGVPVSSAGNLAMYRYLNRLGPHAKRLGIQLVIFNRQSGSARHPWPTYYGGIHPHRDHAHVELNRTASQRLTLATLRAVVGNVNEEDDVFVIKHGESGPRVERCQKIIQVSGKESFGEDLLPEWGPDGDYGQETADAVNAFARRANLPEDGKTGMDVLVLDYCRMILEAARSSEYAAAATGLTRERADELYVKRGTTISLD